MADILGLEKAKDEDDIDLKTTCNSRVPISGPTSPGLFLEVVCFGRFLSRGCRALYLAPTRALYLYQELPDALWQVHRKLHRWALQQVLSFPMPPLTPALA